MNIGKTNSTLFSLPTSMEQIKLRLKDSNVFERKDFLSRLTVLLA